MSAWGVRSIVGGRRITARVCFIAAWAIATFGESRRTACVRGDANQITRAQGRRSPRARSRARVGCGVLQANGAVAPGCNTLREPHKPAVDGRRRQSAARARRPLEAGGPRRDFRYNHRAAPAEDDADRTAHGLRGIEGEVPDVSGDLTTRG
jgi:hypothetical protein